MKEFDLLLENKIESRIRKHVNPLMEKIKALEGQLSRQNKNTLMTKKEVSLYLGVSEGTINNYVKRGLKKIKITDRMVRFKKSDVDAFVDEIK